MDLAQFGNVAMAGLTAGAIYGMLALAYNVVFSATGTVNFAQGEMLMISLMVGSVLIVSAQLPVVLAFIGVVVVVVPVGIATERFAVRPAIKRGHTAFGWVLSTLGVALVLRAATGLIFGLEIRSFPAMGGDAKWNLGGVIITPTQLILIGSFLLVGGLLILMYSRTSLGRSLGAVSQDREAALLRGLPVNRMAMLAFAIASIICAVVAFAAGNLTSAYPTLGLLFGLKGFIAAAVGGMPMIKGAIVGGLILGLFESFGSALFGAGYQNVVVFGLLIVVLLVRPSGIFGRHSARVV